MHSEPADVEAYIAAAPAERRDALELLRRICNEELAGFDETIRYGMPAYLRDGVVEVSFASQKAYISLYVLRQEAMRANAERLATLSTGKGCVRFRRPEQIEPALVRALLRSAADDTGPIC